jgi:hypothetical protein
MTYQKREILKPYIPENALDEIIQMQNKLNFKLIIAKPRKSKLGDFRPVNRKVSLITVNGDLNPYEFLIVLSHEIAHLINWLNYKRRKNPHGKEWKETFHDLIKHFIALHCFPQNISDAMFNCMEKKALSTIKCEQLARVLKHNDSQMHVVFLRDIPDNTEFVLKQGKKFLKLHKVRTRYKCKEVGTGRIYTVHPMAEVQWYNVI